MKIVITLGPEMVGTTAVVTKRFLWFFLCTTRWICCDVTPSKGGIWLNQDTAGFARRSLNCKLNRAAVVTATIANADKLVVSPSLRCKKTKLKLITSQRDTP